MATLTAQPPTWGYAALSLAMNPPDFQPVLDPARGSRPELAFVRMEMRPTRNLDLGWLGMDSIPTPTPFVYFFSMLWTLHEAMASITATLSALHHKTLRPKSQQIEIDSDPSNFCRSLPSCAGNCPMRPCQPIWGSSLDPHPWTLPASCGS